jgi:hypothetical protein
VLLIPYRIKNYRIAKITNQKRIQKGQMPLRLSSPYYSIGTAINDSVFHYFTGKKGCQGKFGVLNEKILKRGRQEGIGGEYARKCPVAPPYAVLKA